jgi:hypothetical protein
MNVATIASILADAAAYAEEAGMELTLAKIHEEDTGFIEVIVSMYLYETPRINLEPEYLMEYARAIRIGMYFYGYIVPVDTALEHTKQYVVLFAA